MALVNPLQIFILPFVFLVALPLALCAGFTTILAFLVLFLRLFLVYFDVGLEWLRFVVLGQGHGRYIQSPSVSRRHSPLISPVSSPPSSPEASSSRSKRRRKRAGSQGSGSTTPLGGLDGLALTPSRSLDRDFEGIGGWRLGDSTDTTEEKAWESLNSRLEMPDHHQRNHFRSHSGGTVLSSTGGVGLHMKPGSRVGSSSPEGLRIANNSSPKSPNTSRSRTPTRTRFEPFTTLDYESYFPPFTAQPKKIGA
ncbi:uncharacterized protein BCR38DRAFT_408762 [Pseudomassariella vexata]|uniref:Uncharacterized protein n=1 Tax=Pseudomassariella vexata TaxID=1141098 RepID=A0A1Y2E0L0_9PEZI|nr:uncharacterized protein BCR38DRAFT_408762 [Pseudomassariella vexata]ORY65017.1 hypothetical protein BCR38DRAFT_408762 [Pseudomassariella vexata]